VHGGIEIKKAMNIATKVLHISHEAVGGETTEESPLEADKENGRKKSIKKNFRIKINMYASCF